MLTRTLRRRAKELDDSKWKYLGEQRVISDQFHALLADAKIDPETLTDWSERSAILAVPNVDLRKALIAKQRALHEAVLAELRNDVEIFRIRALAAKGLADTWAIQPSIMCIALCFGSLGLERIGISPVIGAIAAAAVAILVGLNHRDAMFRARDEAVQDADHELSEKTKTLDSVLRHEVFTLSEERSGMAEPRLA